MASFHLRLPDDLHELLVASAAQEERSLQREIVFRLRKSFVGQIASARTREVAAEVPEGPREVVSLESLAAEKRKGPLAEAGAPVMLPDLERRERHAACKKNYQHHIYHGGKPCPLCGYPA